MKEKLMFKFEIIKTIPIKQNVNLPRYIITESQEEVEKIYKNFNGILNKISYKYSQITGIEKSDLFGEAVLGIATAYHHWKQIPDTSLKNISGGFKIYAMYFIKDILNEYIRLNSASVKIPSYLMKAINNFRKLKNYLETIDTNKDILEQVINNGNINHIKSFLTKNVADKVVEVLKNLISSAERASITLKELYNRSNLISFHKKEINNISNIRFNEEDINTAIIVNKLKSKMNKNELIISNYIMEGYSIPEIGKMMNKEPHWVRYKLKKIKKKVK